MNENPIISVKNLIKLFGSVHAINNLSLDIYPGQIFDIDTNLIINHYEMLMEAQKTFGTKFFKFPPEEMEKLVKIIQPIRNEYATFLDSKGYNGKEIIERFDKLNSRYQY